MTLGIIGLWIVWGLKIVGTFAAYTAIATGIAYLLGGAWARSNITTPVL